MRLTGRDGFSLPDALAALVLIGVLGTVMVRTTLTLGRATRAQQERGIVESAFDLGADYLSTELAEVSRGDVLRISRQSVSYRAFRLTGLACLVAPTEIRILQERLAAVRLPQPGRDSLLIYSGRDSIGGRGGVWASLPIHGIARSSCGTMPALKVTTTIDTAAVAMGSGADVVPVRAFEVMEARFYVSQGSTWLGARSESSGETVQPLAGPFEASGTGFEFFDSAGAVPASPAAVRTIRLSFSGRAPGWDGRTGAHQATAAASLAPENLRP